MTRRTTLSPVVLALLACTIPASGQWDDSRLKPFAISHRETGSSPADVSFLLEAPAGKAGFVRVENGHLVKGNGKRIRFWGVHLTDWSRGSVMLPPKEDAPMWAASLARHGVNMVRLHFIDLLAPRGIVDSTREDTQSFDAQQLDRLDAMVAELKKRGIYVDLNLNVGRTYKAGDGVADADKIRWGKGVILYDERLITLLKQFSKQILTHVNPYTGLEYRRDPAVAIVEILNENAIYLGFRAPTPYYDQQLTDKYNTWLKKNLSVDALQSLRRTAGVEGDAPVPRLQGPQVASAPKDRFDTEMRFFTELETGFYRDMTAYLKDTLEVKVPITASADHGHSGSSYPMLMAHSQMDIIDGHVYWQHPGSPMMNTPMVNDPYNSTVVQLARTAIAGKPYTVSETNHPFPNDWASEGIPILAAYGALHDWDAIIMYTFEPKRDAGWKPYIADPFDISHDPVRMTQMAVGALMFLRGDIQTARKTMERTYSRDQVFESRRLPRDQQPFFTPGYPMAIPLTHSTRIRSFDGPPTAAIAPVDANPIISDTRELAWYTSEKTGMVTVDTDRTQAVVGFLRVRPAVLKNLSVDVSNTFGAVVMTSLDNKPIAISSRMLLSASSRVTNTGLQWNQTRNRVAQSGGSPTLIEPVTGSIKLAGIRGARSVKITALDGSGRRSGKAIHATKTGGVWSLVLGETPTTWYVLEVER